MRTYKVNVDVASFVVGTVLSAEQVLPYFEALFAVGTEPPATFRNQLTDTEALAILEAIDGDDAQADVKRLEKLTEAVKVKPSITAAGNKTRLGGIEFGQRLLTVPEINATLAAGVEAKQTREDLPIDLAILVDKLLPRGGNGKINAPFPGVPSTMEVKDNNGQTIVTLKTETPDTWKAQVNGKPVVGSYYGDAVAQLPSYKLFQQVIDMIDFVKGGDNAPATCEKAVTLSNGDIHRLEHIREMNVKPYTLNALKDRMRSAQNDLLGRFRIAVRTVMQFEHVGQMTKTGVELACEPKPGASGLKLGGIEVVPPGFERLRVRNCIYLYTKGVQGGAIDPIAVTSFQNLVIRGGINDPYNSPVAVPKAVGMDATPTELKATVSRDTKDGATVAKVVAIDGLPRFGDYMAEALAFIAKPDNYTLLNAALANKQLDPHMIVTLCRMGELLSGWSDRPAVKAVWDMVEAQEAAEMQQEADEAKAKLKRLG